MNEVGLSRSEFFRRLYEQARLFSRAMREGEPEHLVATSHVSDVPAMRVVGGRPVYLWREGEKVLARSGQCPRDGLSIYWRLGPAGSAFLCPNCGQLEPSALTPIPAQQQGDWIRVELA